MRKILFFIALTVLGLHLFAVDFSIELHDTYGDGWNGGILSVSVNETVALENVTLTGGFGPAIFNFPVEDGDEVFIDYTEGQWGGENEYIVYNDIGVIIASSGADSTTPEDTSFTVVVEDATIGIISGTVTDTAYNPISSAEIKISGALNYITITDENGFYSQEVITGYGSYEITCAAIGHIESSIQDIEAIENETVTVDFQLEPLPGGDTIEDPFQVSGAIFTDNGDSSPYWDNYEMGNNYTPYFQDAPDVVYSITLDEFQTVSVSLQGSSYDTQMAIYAEGVYPSFNNQLYYNDDYDFSGRASLSDYRRSKEEKLRDRSVQSAIMGVSLQPGTFYVVIDGINGASGEYQIQVDIDDYVPSAYDEDFEEGIIPEEWLVVDNDQDSQQWEITDVSNFLGGESFSGVFYVRVFAEYYDNPVDADDWLISPSLTPTSDSHLATFHYRAVTPYWTEELDIRLSTTGTDVDDFDILLDEIIVDGNNDWHQHSVDISAYNGQQVHMAFVYTGGVNTGFAMDIDAISLPLFRPANDIGILSFNPNSAPIVGEENTYNVKIKNYGNETADYSVKLYSQSGIELNSIDGVNLFTNQTYNCNITWTPSEIETVEIYAKVEIIDDENTLNDESYTVTAYVQPAGTICNNVGEENYTAGNEPSLIPIANFFSNTISETVYQSNELSGPGLINAVAYHYEFGTDVEDFDLTVRMGEIEDNDLSNGIVLAGELETVFEGDVYFSAATGTVVIPLDFAYEYNGGNLAIMLHHSGTVPLGPYNKFILTPAPYNSLRTGARAHIVPVDPYEPSSEFAYFPYIPNTSIYINSQNLGSLQGVITNDSNTLLEGVKVEIESNNTNQISYTDENGAYSFNMVPVGNYQFTASSFGYQDGITDIVITENNLTTADLSLIDLGTVSVSGNLFGSDNPTLGLANAEIKLAGYDDYLVTTNTNGHFQIDNVYVDNEYELTVTANRFENATITVNVSNADLTLDDIFLTELILPVTSFLAQPSTDETVINLTWNEASNGIREEFRYDDGWAFGALGFGYDNEFSIFGSVYYDDTQIEELSWFLRDWGYHAEAKLVILGLDENNIPDGDNIIFDSGMIPNVDGQWNTHTLENPVVVEGGYYYGVMTPGVITLIATDSGTLAPYEFVYNTHYYNWDMNNSNGWELHEDNGFMENYLMRVNGINLGSNEFTGVRKNNKVKNKTMLPDHPQSEPINVGQPSFRNFTNGESSREVQGYNLFRFAQEDLQSPGSWTEIATNIAEVYYTDTDWANLSAGSYYYAVNAIFAEGISAVSISNMVSQDMSVSITINVEDMEGNSAEGAEVNIYNEDNEYSGTTDANGELLIPEVWLGNYTLEVNLENYNFYREDNINIFYSQDIDVTLVDMLIRPFNVQAEYIPEVIEATVSWEAPENNQYEFRYDDGVLDGGVIGSNTENNMVGSIFRYDTYLTSVSWMSVPSAPLMEVKIVILGLDDSQLPDQNQVLYESEMIPNTTLEWCTYNLDEMVVSPNGFFVGISAPNEEIGIAFDDGVGAPYPYQAATFVACDDWTSGTNEWSFIDQYFPNNLLIRAYGINYGELETRNQVSKNHKSVTGDFASYELASTISSSNKSEIDERALLSYNVYRLQEGEETTPENWVLVTEETTETSINDETLSENGTYLYAIKATYSGNHISETAFSNSIEVTNVDTDNNEVPAETKLYGNYPNPFNPTTTISFSLKETGNVSLDIYNVKGQLVKTLLNGELEAAQHKVTWNGKDNNDRNVSSGIYFSRLNASRLTSTKKMLLLK